MVQNLDSELGFESWSDCDHEQSKKQNKTKKWCKVGNNINVIADTRGKKVFEIACFWYKEATREFSFGELVMCGEKQ